MSIDALTAPEVISLQVFRDLFAEATDIPPGVVNVVTASDTRTADTNEGGRLVAELARAAEDRARRLGVRARRAGRGDDCRSGGGCRGRA